MDDFAELFEDLEDPRTGNAKRHALHEMVLIALCAVLSGGEMCADMAAVWPAEAGFLKRFLALEHGIPSHDTFSRLFRLLDPAAFRTWFIAFMQRFAETCEGVVALDGKTLRRSFDRASAASPLHLVSAWAADQRLVLGQLAVGDKSNEIVAVPKLLELLSLKGMIITADALNCQRQIAAQVIEQGGDYALALKGNQPALLDDVRRFLDDAETPLRSASETDAGHGRIETRTASLSGDIAWLQDSHAWPGLAAVGKVTAMRQIDGKTRTQTRYYLLSQAVDPARFNAIVRGHWSIENSLHWVLDVIMDEDQLRNRKDHGPENLALLRRLALNLAKLEPSKGSMRGKLKRAAWDTTFLGNLLAQFARPQMR